MNKQEFLMRLSKGLSGLPREDREERLSFYSEMIDDRIEEGLSEEEAVSAVGKIEDIVSRVIADTPLTKLAKERIKSNRRLEGWEILLLILGFPVWLPLLVAFFAVILSVYVVLWSVIISLWAVFASLIGCGFGFVATGIILAIAGKGLIGAALFSAGLVCAGLAIFLFFGITGATKGVLWLTKKFAVLIKNCFIKKEEA